jgi:hypothetical protein
MPEKGDLGDLQQQQQQHRWLEQGVNINNTEAYNRKGRQYQHGYH